jgi:aspartyl-tRNA(Asn)/glutamyl-tRNA(Gln) amidotransferase subunit B
MTMLMFATLNKRILRRRNLAAFLSSSLSCWKVDPWTGTVWNDENPHDQYQVIVGLEIHAQLQIPTKLFSPASYNSSSTSTVNSSRHVHPFDVAVPGKLPQLSAAAVEKAVLVAAALNCEIQNVSRFERKHYAYADLPTSYQITQQRWPLALNGLLECDWMVNNKKKAKQQNDHIRCRVERVQLEQDTGKTTTVTRTEPLDDAGTANRTTTYSRVDFSRAGCALVEVVLAPDLRSSLEAASVVHAIRQLLRVTQTCAARMEEGHLRVDCNVNIRKKDGTLSPRVEVKNLNSIQQVQDAVDYEARRAAALMHTAGDGVLLREETRTWDVLQKKTTLTRTKDQAPDYRFLPEPDLPPLVLSDCLGGTLEEFLKKNLGELPAAARKRLQQEPFRISDDQARILAGDPAAIRILEEAVETVIMEQQQQGSAVLSSSDAAKTAANLLCNELVALVKEHHAATHHYQPTTTTDDEDDHVSMVHSLVSGKQLGELAVMLLVEESISTTMAKKLLSLLFTANEQSKSPREVAAEHGFRLVTNTEDLRQLCRNVIANHPRELDVYQRGGKFVIKMKKLFTGKAMVASEGNAHPERLRDALEHVLEEIAPGV